MLIVIVRMLNSARCACWLVVLCLACGSGVDRWILAWIRWAGGWKCIFGEKEHIYDLSITMTLFVSPFV